MTIKELRTAAGLTQKAMAEKYNIPKRCIENWEGNKNKPPVYLVQLLERAMKEDFNI